MALLEPPCLLSFAERTAPVRRAAFLVLPMIYAISALLVFQLIGELIVRTLGLPLPGALAGTMIIDCCSWRPASGLVFPITM